MTDPGHAKGPVGRPDGISPPATPRWVKAIGVAIVIALIVVVAVLVLGGGQHGPSRHTGSTAFPGQGIAAGSSLPTEVVGRVDTLDRPG